MKSDRSSSRPGKKARLASAEPRHTNQNKTEARFSGCNSAAFFLAWRTIGENYLKILTVRVSVVVCSVNPPRPHTEPAARGRQVVLTLPSIGLVACAPDWLARHDAAWLPCSSVTDGLPR